jgi:hypothetical protein
MPDRGSPRWKYIAEIARLAQVQTIGKLHAFNGIRRGGVKQMEVRQEHLRSKLKRLGNVVNKERTHS